MARNLIVDVDGVLLDWRSGFNQWIHSHGLISSLDEWPLDQYDPPPSLPKEVVGKVMQMFNQTHFISKLTPEVGAIKAMKHFHECGFSIHVVTAFSNEYESIKMREQNLINVFGPIFQEITCLPIRSPKVDYLKKMPANSIYIEDMAKHLIEGIEAGLDQNNLYLIPQPWNSSFLSSGENRKYPGIQYRGWKWIYEDRDFV